MHAMNVVDEKDDEAAVLQASIEQLTQQLRTTQEEKTSAMSAASAAAEVHICLALLPFAPLLCLSVPLCLYLPSCMAMECAVKCDAGCC